MADQLSGSSECRQVRTGPESLQAIPDRQDALCLLSVFDRLEVKALALPASSGDKTFDQLVLNPLPNASIAVGEAAAVARAQANLDVVGHLSGGTHFQGPVKIIGKLRMHPDISIPNYSLNRSDVEQLVQYYGR